MSPYQVLEYHMEFLETFGCNWSPKEVFKVIIGRAPYRSDQSGATPSSRSDLPVRATLPERQGRVARVLITRRCENESGATSRSDTARSLPKHGATTRSDERRSLAIALAPAVLAHLYADLSLLKDHTRAFTRSKSIELSASLFKLVQVWTWERFRELRPRPNLLLEGQPRLALWDEVKQGKNDVRKILDNSSFEWRPYTKAVENWKLPKFYPEKAMWVPVGPDLDEELISFARCIKACELVGMDSVEHYFPNRVASQFGMLQDAPSPPPVVNRNNLSREAAREEYNKAIDDLTLYILSRVTPTFCDWWKEKGVVESSETLKSRNIVGDLGPKKRKRIRENNDEEDVSEPLCRKCRLAAANVDKDVTPPEREQRKGTDETGSKAGKRVVLSPSHPPSSALGRAMGIVISSTKSCDDERCESIVQKMTLIDYVTKETEFSLHEGGAITGDKESSESLIHNDETGWKNMVRSPNNSSDPLRGFDDATHDTHVSPPLETRQTCDDEIDVHGSNVEKMTVPDDGNKEPECLLHEDGGMSGGEKESSEKKEDEILIQTKIASNADNNEPTPCENLAPGGSEVLGESKSGNPLGDEAQGDDCLFDDTVLGSEEPMKSSERLEKRKEDVGDGNDLYEKSLHNVKELASSIEKLALSIDERIAKAERNVAWLKAMRDAKQRKTAAAAARLI
ncbi:hypothetical protein YC2023_075614 [Brassica napus]